MNVLTIGSAVVDIFIMSEAFQVAPDEQGLHVQTSGGKMSVQNFTLQTGGGASNTAVGFQKMGFEATIIAELGRDELAELVVNDLTRAKVATQYLIHEKKEQTGGSVILVSESGRRVALVHRGAASQLDAHDIDQTAIQSADWIHLTGLAGRTATVQTIFAHARTAAKKISWNPGSADLTLLAKGTLSLNDVECEVLLVNKEEWELIRPVQDQCRRQIAMVIVTNGGEGGWIFQGHHTTEYQAHPTQAVDMTGAGDAFGVGFVSAILAGEDPMAATKWGAANAASVVQQIGAKPGLLSRTELETILSRS